jgi:hypothetical protein
MTPKNIEENSLLQHANQKRCKKRMKISKDNRSFEVTRNKE